MSHSLTPPILQWFRAEKNYFDLFFGCLIKKAYTQDNGNVLTNFFTVQGPVVQKPVGLTRGYTKYLKQTSQLFAYKVEHVFPQIFSG